MTATDLIQVVPTRSTLAFGKKSLRACYHQLVKNLLRADDKDLLEQPVMSLLASSILLRYVLSVSTEDFENWH